jgi:Fic family protein
MRPTPTNATLPQLLDRYRAASTRLKDGKLNELIRLTYQSMAIEGSSLNLAQTQNLLQNGEPIPGKSLTDQWRTIDHHQALEQMLGMASQREPLNPIALQDIAATLMRQTGGPTYSLLSQFDTSKGDFRIDSAMVGRRAIVAAHKLPVAIIEWLKGVNTRINQLNTPRQVYDSSFEAHFHLLTLHPFGAGNGPMARLLMNYIQCYHHLPLSLVYVDHRGPYLTSLDASWRQKTAVPIVIFLHSQLLRLLAESLEQPPNEHALD